MIEIILYSKEGCGLCDEVKGEIERLITPQTPYRLTEIDITSDSDLFAKYRFSIPVLQIGKSVLQAPIHSDAIIAAIQTL